MLGNEVVMLVNSMQTPGLKSVMWDAMDSQHQHVSAGVYIYKIQAGHLRQTGKMVLMK